MDDSNPPEIVTHHQNFAILHMQRTHIHTYLQVGFQSRVCIHYKAMEVFALLPGSPSYLKVGVRGYTLHGRVIMMTVRPILLTCLYSIYVLRFSIFKVKYFMKKCDIFLFYPAK